LGGKRFTEDEGIETEILKWLRQQPKDFYAASFGRTCIKAMEHVEE
jgi:hypothetical protein